MEEGGHSCVEEGGQSCVEEGGHSCVEEGGQSDAGRLRSAADAIGTAVSAGDAHLDAGDTDLDAGDAHLQSDLDADSDGDAEFDAVLEDEFAPLRGPCAAASQTAQLGAGHARCARIPALMQCMRAAQAAVRSHKQGP